jgi:response regulator of citrate/malate metabolism
MSLVGATPSVVVATRDPVLGESVLAAFEPLGSRAPRVTQVGSGAECITALCLLNPALLVFDDAVTDRPGPELVDEVHRLRPNVRVVYIASEHSMSLERAARCVGVLFYVARPLDAGMIEPMLLGVLDRSGRNAS